MGPPLNNINGSLVNVDGSNYGGSSFTSRVLPNTVNPAVLPEPLSNIQAANSYIPCPMNGGRRSNKKIKNISSMYKMKMSKMKMSKMKMSKIKRKKSIKRGGKRTNRKVMRRRKGMYSRKMQRGGYAQYQNNLPMTQTYSLGGHLPGNLSALANPAPYHKLSNCTNCVDNYSYYKNSGFPSKGWW